MINWEKLWKRLHTYLLKIRHHFVKLRNLRSKKRHDRYLTKKKLIMWKELKNFIIKIIEELLSDIKTEKKPILNRELMIFIQKKCFILLTNVFKPNEGPKKKPVISSFQIRISLRKYSTFSKNIIDTSYSALFKKR